MQWFENTYRLGEQATSAGRNVSVNHHHHVAAPSQRAVVARRRFAFVRFEMRSCGGLHDLHSLVLKLRLLIRCAFRQSTIDRLKDLFQTNCAGGTSTVFHEV